VEGGLEVQVPIDRWPAAATRVRLSIRPEKLQLSRSFPEAPGAFAAVVEEELFKGAMVRCNIKTDAGTRLQAVASSDRARGEAFRIGERIWCTVHPEDIVVLL
jgi:spermidine/putrescine transport system ATP-binding protein